MVNFKEISGTFCRNFRKVWNEMSESFEEIFKKIMK